MCNIYRNYGRYTIKYVSIDLKNFLSMGKVSRKSILPFILFSMKRREKLLVMVMACVVVVVSWRWKSKEMFFKDFQQKILFTCMRVHKKYL